MKDLITFLGDNANSDSKLDEISIISKVHKDMAKMLILAGDADELVVVDIARSMYNKNAVCRSRCTDKKNGKVKDTGGSMQVMNCLK